MSTPLLEDKCNQGDPSSPRMTLQTFKLTYPCGHKGICSLNIDQELLSETKAFQMPGLSTFCCLCWWHLRLYLNVRLFSEMSDCFWSVRLLSEVSSSVFQHGHSCISICQSQADAASVMLQLLCLSSQIRKHRYKYTNTKCTPLKCLPMCSSMAARVFPSASLRLLLCLLLPPGGRVTSHHGRPSRSNPPFQNFDKTNFSPL